MSRTAGPFDAESYDRWFDSAWGRYALEVESRALRRAVGEVRGAAALDVGCGSGRFAEVLAAAGAEVVGVDAYPAMVALTRRRGHRGVVGDGGRLPFREGCCDLAITVTVLEFVDSPRELVAELMRVTRRRGRVVIGLLNRASPWGMASARRRRRGLWASARLLPAGRVVAWCQPYGPVRRYGALYAPGAFPGFRRLGPVLEAAGRLFPRLGAFQLLVVERR
jgi:SAM-dependent methyltransferase